MGRARTASRPAPGQLTIKGFLDDVARRAVQNDPMKPAVRLFLVVLALMGVGLVVQASALATTREPAVFRAELIAQVAFRLAGIAVMVVAFRVGPSGLRRWLGHLALICIVLLVMVYTSRGVVLNGARRWVDLGPLTFQPSELARIVLLMWIAHRCIKLGDLVVDLRRGILPILGLVATFTLLVARQTDFGGAMLMFFCALMVMWVGGARLMPIATLAASVIGGGLALAVAFVPYMRSRISMFLGHQHNAQLEDTVLAMSKGGAFGEGLTHGASRNAGVPYLESDCVFGLVGEELGLVGMLLVLGLLVAFLWFAGRLVLSVRDRYETLVSFGLLVSVALQAMLHVQVVAGLAPPKGMTLPFISDGGTSLLVSSLAVGLALGAARRSHPPELSCNPSNATV